MTAMLMPMFDSSFTLSKDAMRVLHDLDGPGVLPRSLRTLKGHVTTRAAAHLVKHGLASLEVEKRTSRMMVRITGKGRDALNAARLAAQRARAKDDRPRGEAGRYARPTTGKVRGRGSVGGWVAR